MLCNILQGMYCHVNLTRNCKAPVVCSCLGVSRVIKEAPELQNYSELQNYLYKLLQTRMQSGHGGGSKTKLSKQQRVHCRTTHYWCNIKLDSWLVMHPMPWTMERGSQLLMHPGHLLRKKKKKKKKPSLTDTSRSNPTINPVQ